LKVWVVGSSPTMESFGVNLDGEKRALDEDYSILMTVPVAISRGSRRLKFKPTSSWGMTNSGSRKINGAVTV
jgi:hypothetical protein